MENVFNGFESELKDLDPRARGKAEEIASRLIAEQGYEKRAARKEAVKKAAQWFYNLEG